MNKQRASFLGLSEKESKFSFWMICYFFFVIATFWVLKPLKKTLFIQFYDKTQFDFLGYLFSGAQAELLAKTANVGVAVLALMAFIHLSRKFKGHKLTLIFCLFFIVSLLVLKGFLIAGSESAIWVFYLMGDLFSTLMVVSFFAFLNHSVTPAASKRLYGVIGIGGILGGVVGTNFLRTWLDEISINNWIYISISTISVIGYFAYQASKYVPETIVETTEEDKLTTKLKKDGLISTAREVLSNSYLVKLCLLISLYEMASTIMDFQLSTIVGHYFDGPEIGSFFATLYSITTWLSLFGQVVLANVILRYFGVRQGLLILPVLIAIAAFGFILMPLVAIAGAMVIIDNGLNYSINQSSRETLYVPLPVDLKYKAKGFIDIFVVRLSKVFAVALSLGLSMYFNEVESLRLLSVVILVIAIAWVRTVYSISKDYKVFSPEEVNRRLFSLRPIKRLIGLLFTRP